jgi:pimeloyl-ACP methyl ester carboxylesterase
VVLCHGFPELAYSWRHQLPALAEAGFRAIAPDMRGYGGSSRPDRVEDYGLTELTGDLVGLLDMLGIERAVFVGHDWGGFVAWAMPVLHPERCAGVVGVCTPYVAMPVTSVLRMLVGGEDERLYILWFQQPGVAEAVLDSRAPLLFDRLMRAPLAPEGLAARALVDGKLDLNPFRRLEQLAPETDPLLSEEELAVYVETFERSGFRGGINWYRNIDRNAREHPDVGSRKLELPCLMLCAAWDPALRPEMAAGMPARCADLSMHTIERAGHWVQQEQPDAVNRLLVGWLRERF